MRKQRVSIPHVLHYVSREDTHDGAVIKLAQKLLNKKATHGWEFVKKKGFKGIKFHVFDNSSRGMVVWSFSAVAESSLDDAQVKSFLEKLVYITEPMRESEEWHNGEVLSAQATFAPILLQKMEQVRFSLVSLSFHNRFFTLTESCRTWNR